MEEEKPKARFLTTHQGAATNELTKAKIDESNTVEYPSGTIRITQKNLIVEINEYTKIDSKLKTSTYRLLDFLIMEYTTVGMKSLEIEISLKHYMKICGLKNGSTTRRQIKNDLEILYSMRISHMKSSHGDYELKNCRIIESKEISRGFFSVRLSQSLFEYLKSRTVMPYPLELFKINLNIHPYSYYLLRKISEHKNMNFDKNNSNVVSIKSLLEAARFPEYEKVVSTGQIQQRIIKPFERDMTALSNVLKWNYKSKSGDVIEAGRILKVRYSEFSELLVEVGWNEYPNRPKKRKLSTKKTKKQP